MLAVGRGCESRESGQQAVGEEDTSSLGGGGEEQAHRSHWRKKSAGRVELGTEAVGRACVIGLCVWELRVWTEAIPIPTPAFEKPAHPYTYTQVFNLKGASLYSHNIYLLWTGWNSTSRCAITTTRLMLF